MITRKNITQIFCLAAALLLGLSQVQAKEVGEVTYVRGILTSQVEGQQARLVGKDMALRNGDVLSTGTRGFALIKFNDGTKMTLRPNTKFKINKVETEKGKENAFFSLLRGGFRAITGAISKASPSAFRVDTPVATIGIRGTEFDARLCDEDCENEDKNLKAKLTYKNESKVIGRIALLRGKAISTNPQGNSHKLFVGGAVYEQDKLETQMNSYAVIAFNDKSRVTMSPNSAFEIQEHQFKPEDPAENSSFLSFLRGGLRVVSGLIGKLNRPAYRVGTPTATIGIRGTGFDLKCEGACVSGSNTSSSFDPVQNTAIAKLLRFFVKPAYAANDNGMFAFVWSGTIELQLPSGTTLLQNGKAAFLKNGFSAPIILPDIPVQIKNMGGAPRPDTIEIKDELFGGVEQKEVEPGLYVNVRHGDVQVKGDDGKVVNLGQGEAGLAGLSGVTTRLKFVPAFQKLDVIPNPVNFNEKVGTAIDLLGLEKDQKTDFECTIQ